MRYLCVHCDHRFEHDSEQDKPRCPKCMRVHGIEKLRSETRGSRLSRRGWIAIAAAVLVLAGGGYGWWAFAGPVQVSGDPPLRPLSEGELRAYLKNDKVDAKGRLGLLRSSEDIERFAEKAAGDAEGAQAKAKAITGALRKRASDKAFVPLPLTEPRKKPALRTAAETLDAMGEGAKVKSYPLEIAALATAALRAVDVDAMLAEAWAFPGDQRPPDPSGYFGYYLVGVWPKGVGQGEPKLFDPYGGHETKPDSEHRRELTDVQAVAAGLGHRAIHALIEEGDTDKAFSLSEDALALDRRSPPVRTVRGFVLLRSGGVNEGLSELQSAAKIRSDAPRLNNLAGVYLAKGQVDQASRKVTAALDKHDEYAAGHATLASIHLAKRETDLARSELETAERLDADAPKLPGLWAQYYLQTGQLETAVAKARQAVKRRPNNWQARLQAGRIYRQAGYYDEMRREAQRILEMVPDRRKTRVRKLIKRVLGPTAFDKVASAGDGGMGGGELAGGGSLDSFDLKKGSSLLGGGSGQTGGGPSLLGDEKLGEGLGGSQPLPSGGGGSKLRLDNPGDDLKLDLDTGE